MTEDEKKVPALSPEATARAFCLLANMCDARLEVRALLARLPGGACSLPRLLSAGAALGLPTRLVSKKAADLLPQTLPCMLFLEGGESLLPCVLENLNGDTARVHLPEGVFDLPLEEVARRQRGNVVFPALHEEREVSGGRLEPDYDRKKWWKDVVMASLPTYRDVAVASLVVNLLSLASPLFIMNVYDRVIPNNARESLWVMALGLALAYAMDFALRFLRSSYVDLAGRNADVALNVRILDKLLHARLDALPPSVGTLANNVREFEQVREFFGSATLLAMLDLPFICLFLAVIAWLGGPMVWLPLLAVPVMLLVGRLLQEPFRGAAERQFRQNAAKNALLVEMLGGLETIRASQSQPWLARRWENAAEAGALAHMRARRLGMLAGHGVVLVNALLTMGVIIWGAYRISAHEMSMGALVACVLILGRIMQPLGQIAQLLGQWQKSRAAMRALGRIMELPEEGVEQAVDHGPLPPSLGLEGVSFSYPGGQEALSGVSLHIRPGEKVALMGRSGSGKSTLARLLLGLYQPGTGRALVGGVDVRHQDPLALRARIGFMPQDNYLFYGSVLENIAMSLPGADDRRILGAAALAGVTEFALRHPQGLGMPVGERGMALSGGQRQAVALARTLIRDPDIVILDEPSSHLDLESERALMERCREAMRHRTLLVLTHRPSLLELVDRVIVLERGRVVADGPRDQVLAAMRGGRKEGGA